MVHINYSNQDPKIRRWEGVKRFGFEEQWGNYTCQRGKKLLRSRKMKRRTRKEKGNQTNPIRTHTHTHSGRETWNLNKNTLCAFSLLHRGPERRHRPALNFTGQEMDFSTAIEIQHFRPPLRCVCFMSWTHTQRLSCQISHTLSALTWSTFFLF